MTIPGRTSRALTLHASIPELRPELKRLLRIKKKLETDINELEIALDHANGKC